MGEAAARGGKIKTTVGKKVTCEIYTVGRVVVTPTFPDTLIMYILSAPALNLVV